MKIALLGYGKMGKTIEKLAIEKGHSIVYKNTSDWEEGSFEDTNVAIEFSTPEAAISNIKRCFEARIPVVCGTTGWLSEYPTILKLCQQRNGSFIYASNFSIGVNLFFSLNSHFAKLMAPWKEYIPSIEEIHHTQKKDAPSGTAISLAESLIESNDTDGWVLDTEEANKISIKAIREGDVKGTHTVSYQSKVDSLSIKHEAHTREGFALGAILAAEWLVDKKGVFTMKDVLDLKE